MVVIGALLLEFGAAYILILLLIKLGQYSRTFFSFILRRFGVGENEPTYSFLQLTFPADTTKSAYATEQLHILMRSMVKYYSFWDKLAARKQPYSLEIVATRDNGIRYIVRIPKRELETVKRIKRALLKHNLSCCAVTFPEPNMRVTHNKVFIAPKFFFRGTFAGNRRTVVVINLP